MPKYFGRRDAERSFLFPVALGQVWEVPQGSDRIYAIIHVDEERRRVAVVAVFERAPRLYAPLTKASPALWLPFGTSAARADGFLGGVAVPVIYVCGGCGGSERWTDFWVRLPPGWQGTHSSGLRCPDCLGSNAPSPVDGKDRAPTRRRRTRR